MPTEQPELTDGLVCAECGFVTSTPHGLGSHRRKKHGVKGTSKSARAAAKKVAAPKRTTKAKPQEAGEVDTMPTIAQLKQEITVEQATAAVLYSKFPKGIRTPDEHLRAVRLVKAVEHG